MLAIACVAARSVSAEEKGITFPWSVSLSPGWIDFEGDQAVKDNFMGTVRLSYDYDEWWTLEGVLGYAPSLKGSHYNDYSKGYAVDVDRLEDQTGEKSTWALSVGLDALYHFTRWKRLDPFLALGVGVMKYGADWRDNGGLDTILRGGGGLMYHFNDEWAVRIDYRNQVAGAIEKSDANTVVDAGITWTWGAHVPANYRVGSGPKDSDADGLTDAEEAQIGTNPYDPDTDADGLTDFEEVRKYNTNPLEPDTDFDGLKDGVEVNVYKTNPLVRDTDNGGVADGHEVIEDGTDPLNPADDLILYTLDIQFDYDKAIIKEVYFPQIDVVGKTLVRDSGATARIEGHADKLKGSKADYNKKLSEARAQAVAEYLHNNFSIKRERMKAVGYGFDRPKAKNDPVYGNPVNRRVEVYIRKSGQAEETAPTGVAPAK
jgi:outer membrane protein OmpA-like peptidoglycan-associated protein